MNKIEIKNLMSQNLEEAFSSLKRIFAPNSKHYDEVILLEGALNDLYSHLSKGLISYAENLSEMSKLRYKALCVIEKIPESLFVDSTITNITPDEEDTDLGIIDHIIESVNDLKLVQNILEELTNAMGDLSEEISLETKNIERINHNNNEGQKRNILLQRILQRMGEKLEKYNMNLSENSKFLEYRTKSSITHMDLAVTEYYQFYNLQEEDVAGLEILYTSVLGLCESSDAAISGLDSFRMSVDQFPNLEKGFNKSRKTTALFLENIIITIKNFKERSSILSSTILSLLPEKQVIELLPSVIYE